MPNYTHSQLSDAIAALATRLHDATNQFWPSAELKSYIIEALRNWNALTSTHRDEMTFPLVQGQSWYDLTAQPGTLRPYTVLDNDLITQIQYHILEPITPAYPLVWSGSLQFTLTDILGALERRSNETLALSGCTITRTLVPAPLATYVLLPDTTTIIRRVVWIPNPGLGYTAKILRQSDPIAKRSFDYHYRTAASSPPVNWTQNTEPPPAFDVDRTPPVLGQYEVLSINSQPSPSTTSSSTLTIPDDWTWVAKWGALMDLLSREANSKDPLRAKYCEQRYVEGIGLLSRSSSVLSVLLNSSPLSVDAVRNGDDFNPLWQTELPYQSVPSSVYTTGLNLVGFGRAPDANPYTAIILVVQTATVPAVDADYIQISRDDYSTLLDYAHHLAMFKVGGQEFVDTVPLYQKFLIRAGLYNAKLSAMGFFQKQLEELSQMESIREPAYSSDSDSGGA